MAKSKEKRPEFLPVGPILDSKDLKEKEVIAALVAAAEMVVQTPEITSELGHYKKWLAEDYDTLTDSDKASVSSEVITHLEDILSVAAPPFCTFSGPNGEHRSWGVWPDQEALTEGVREGSVANTVEMINIAAWRKHGRSIPDYNLVVNDHGKMTLYRKSKIGRGYRWKEVWSVV